MKKFQLIIIILLTVIAIGYGMNASKVVLADDHDDYYHDSRHDEDEDSPFEEVGEMAGWGTAILMGSAGLLFPIRKTTKLMINGIPSSKKVMIFLSKLLGKQHVLLGVLALIIASAHGIFMFWDEGLGVDAFTGIGSILFMLIAAFLGSYLIKNKKAKAVRKTHIFLLILSSLIAIIHIFIA